ncbi:transporter associated domain-containing protein, partial [Klebsiella pneumoniae]|uniref:transporter associated domain-containing protein n=1 Tax=Klebsiella pneumoniae TaxID=573 RepID=UPI003A88681E
KLAKLEIVRTVLFVPPLMPVGDLLQQMQLKRVHMAIVIDEFGGTDGVVTIEDVLEAVVGEIEDEFDMPDDSIERVDDQTVRVDGTFPIDDFNEQFAKDLPHEDYHTLAGFVFGELGRAP